jgi:hypothetical protein
MKFKLPSIAKNSPLGTVQDKNSPLDTVHAKNSPLDIVHAQNSPPQGEFSSCTVSRGEFWACTVSRGEFFGCAVSRGMPKIHLLTLCMLKTRPHKVGVRQIRSRKFCYFCKILCV